MAVGESWQYGGLRWSVSCSCPFCGNAYEMDGRGLTPQDIRDAMISEEGEWELHVSDSAAPKTRIAMVLRQEQVLSLAQTAALIRTMSGVSACGTQAEMQCLAHLIHAECGSGAVVVLKCSRLQWLGSANALDKYRWQYQQPVPPALRAKGYRLTLWYTLEGEYRSNFDAEKDGRSFSATSPEELLGLVAMWEVRGDKWHTGHEEDIFDELMNTAVTYDSDGNVVEDEKA